MALHLSWVRRESFDGDIEPPAVFDRSLPSKPCEPSSPPNAPATSFVVLFPTRWRGVAVDIGAVIEADTEQEREDAAWLCRSGAVRPAPPLTDVRNFADKEPDMQRLRFRQPMAGHGKPVAAGEEVDAVTPEDQAAAERLLSSGAAGRVFQDEDKSGAGGAPGFNGADPDAPPLSIPIRSENVGRRRRPS